VSEIEFDTRLVSFREHVESRDELKDRIAQIELEQAKQRAALMHLPDEVRRLSALIADALGRLNAAPPAPAQTGADHYALSLHRIADMFAKRSGGASPVLMAFALLGAAAAGALAFFLATKLA
jgi:septal ring factor EnvC (AmiA/AmiB activator)